jgi:hypothetical protein
MILSGRHYQQQELPAGLEKPALQKGHQVNVLHPAPAACRPLCRSYTVPGKRNTLLLHCSLQRASGRMLVHTVEVNNPDNDHVSCFTRVRPCCKPLCLIPLTLDN